MELREIPKSDSGDIHGGIAPLFLNDKDGVDLNSVQWAAH